MAVGSNYFLLLTVCWRRAKVASLAQTETAAAVRAWVSARRLLAAYCLLPAAYCRVAAVTLRCCQQFSVCL